jgi:hypothetical protein
MNPLKGSLMFRNKTNDYYNNVAKTVKFLTFAPCAQKQL